MASTVERRGREDTSSRPAACYTNPPEITGSRAWRRRLATAIEHARHARRPFPLPVQEQGSPIGHAEDLHGIEIPTPLDLPVSPFKLAFRSHLSNPRQRDRVSPSQAPENGRTPAAKRHMSHVYDVHNCMGHGEITGVAMETTDDVHVRIELIKARDSGCLLCPQIECTRTVGSVGCHFGRNLGKNVRSAYRDMANRMVQFHQFDRMNAYPLFGQVGEVVVHQALDDWNAVLVKVAKPRPNE